MREIVNMLLDGQSFFINPTLSNFIRKYNQEKYTREENVIIFSAVLSIVERTLNLFPRYTFLFFTPEF